MKRVTLIFIFSLFSVLLFHSVFALAAECKTKYSEEAKIDLLILAVENMEGSFIRNGEEHNSKAAADHLRLKINNAKNSFFASKDDWTALRFIEKIGSKSSISGTAYQIKLKNGKLVLSEEWLKLELKKLSEGCAP